MNGSREAIAEFAEQWAVPLSEALQVAVAVPHPYLQLLAESLPQLALAAQDCAPEAEGRAHGAGVGGHAGRLGLSASSLSGILSADQIKGRPMRSLRKKYTPRSGLA